MYAIISMEAQKNVLEFKHLIFNGCQDVVIGILLDLWPHDDIFMETISEYLLTLHWISTLHSWIFK